MSSLMQIHVLVPKHTILDKVYKHHLLENTIITDKKFLPNTSSPTITNIEEYPDVRYVKLFQIL